MFEQQSCSFGNFVTPPTTGAEDAGGNLTEVVLPMIVEAGTLWHIDLAELQRVRPGLGDEERFHLYKVGAVCCDEGLDERCRARAIVVVGLQNRCSVGIVQRQHQVEQGSGEGLCPDSGACAGEKTVEIALPTGGDRPGGVVSQMQRVCDSDVVIALGFGDRHASARHGHGGLVRGGW